MTTTTTTETTYRAVVLHGENGEFGKSYNTPRQNEAEAWEDADRLAAIPFPDTYTYPRTVQIEETVVTTVTTARAYG